MSRCCPRPRWSRCSGGLPDGICTRWRTTAIPGRSRSDDVGGMPVVIGYNGVVAPAEIKFTGDFMGMPFEFTVTKAK